MTGNVEGNIGSLFEAVVLSVLIIKVLFSLLTKLYIVIDDIAF